MGGRRVGWFKFSERLERETVNYANVIKNVEKAAKSRVFIPTPPWNPSKNFKRILKRAGTRLGKQMEEEYNKEKLEEVLRKFPPKKRQMYADGMDVELDLKLHSRVTAFIKEENVPFVPAKDKPRLIQFRDPVFLSHLLSAMKPLEHAFYHNRYCFNRFQKLTCAKGMNQLQRMEALEEMVRSLEDAHSVDLDGSAWDAHVVREAIKSEWDFYHTAWREAGYSQETRAKMRRMGRAQEVNRVRSRCDDGIAKWKTIGRRMSGDLNTGLGNSVLQSLYIASIMDELKVPEKHWRMLVDGDDAVLMVSGVYADRLAGGSVQQAYLRYSQEVKMTAVQRVSLDRMEVIEFCQSRPVHVDGTWRLIRAPKKVYNGYKMVNLWYRTKTEAERFWATVAPAEMIFATGVPIMQSYFRMLHRLANRATPVEVVSRRFWLRNIKSIASQIIPSEEVSYLTRESFERAFGWSIPDQLFEESQLDLVFPRHLPEHRTESWDFEEPAGATACGYQ